MDETRATTSLSLLLWIVLGIALMLSMLHWLLRMSLPAGAGLRSRTGVLSALLLHEVEQAVFWDAVTLDAMKQWRRVHITGYPASPDARLRAPAA